MHLPCNVKKKDLIELIIAKKYKPSSEVELIIMRLKSERLHLAMSKKKKDIRKKTQESHRFKNAGMRIERSPSITNTPKRVILTSHSAPEARKATIKPKRILRNHTVTRETYSRITTSGSDRVLRSFRFKKLSKDLNICDNIVFNSNGRNTDNANEPLFDFASCERAIAKLTTPYSCKFSFIDEKTQQSTEGQLLCYKTPSSVRNKSRILSRINPLSEMPSEKDCSVKGMTFRGSDGKITQVRGLIYKRLQANCDITNQTDINVEDFFNLEATYIPNDESVKDENFIEKYLRMPPYPGADQDIEFESIKDIDSVDSEFFNSSSVYNKKTTNEIESDEFYNSDYDAMPMIEQGFNFQNKDIVHPLHVQVCDGTENVLEKADKNSNKDMSEQIDNWNNECLTYQPLLQMAKPSADASRDLRGATVKPAGVAHDTSTADNERGCSNATITRQSNHNRTLALREGLFEFYRVQEIVNGSYSDHVTTLPSNSTPEINLTIDEMMEDAMELIIEDGTYMERIELEINAQCLICSWAGPENKLKSHIEMEHPNHITKMYVNECSSRFTLDILTQSELWLSEILEFNSELYVLSVKYENPDCLMASLNTITSGACMKGDIGKISIYNTVTGEPYTWEGIIQPLSVNMPFVNGAVGLKLEMSRLNLLPNSANLKLVNQELVNNSPTKVIVGQPVLSDIHVKVYVRIENSNSSFIDVIS
ncbi:uncharacterized protein [Battus philenor]|uniref:uncharacterized protein n=1 Tax=Battus philenor TaxID=42288 RepID=UPI0035D08844